MTDYKARAKAQAIAHAKTFGERNPGTAELRGFIASFEKFPAELRTQLRPRLKAGGEQAVLAVKAAASWSTRIPGATRLKVSFARKTAGVAIVVDRKKAPHALNLENKGLPGQVRHPRWGDRRHWIGQPAKPFAHPAVQPWFRDVDADIGRAVDAVVRELK